MSYIMIKYPESPTQCATREKLLVKSNIWYPWLVVCFSWECWHWYALWTYKEVNWPQGVIMTISSSNPPLSFSNLYSQYLEFFCDLWEPARYRNIVLANHLITAINYWLMWSFKFLWIQRFISSSQGTDKEGSSKQELSRIIITGLPSPQPPSPAKDKENILHLTS